MLIALGHIVGSVVALIVLGIGGLLFAAWEQGHIEKVLLEEASVDLGVPADELEFEENLQQVLRWSADRYSNELLRNRLSDLCGVVRTAWGWLRGSANHLGDCRLFRIHLRPRSGRLRMVDHTGGAFLLDR